MKSKKIDLITFCITLSFLVLAVWLGVTVRQTGRQERQIDELIKTNEELREDIEELRDHQKKTDDRIAEADERIRELSDLEDQTAANAGNISRIYYTLRKLTRQETQEEQKDNPVAQSDTQEQKTATFESSEARQAEKEDQPAEDDAAPEGMTYAGVYTLTAYEWTGNPCANGNYPTEGYTVASNDYALGTRLYIEGLGVRVVEDTGGMGSGVIDVYMGDSSACYNFGVRSAAVYVMN